MVALLIGFVLAGAVYLLLIDTTQLPELYTGVAITLLAAVAVAAAREQGQAEVRVPLRWLSRIWRPVAQVPPDIVRLSVAALAQLVRPRARRGRIVAVPFAHGEPGDPRDLARRSLAEALGSLAPNTIVLGVDPDGERLLAHRLEGGPEAGEVDVMGLG
jgi:multisubunit Na+/H+ antiporter MnhE subunit